jgi:transcriptional regulator with XRE-family HTH domain
MDLMQCRMARAALDLGIRELADLAAVSPDTVSRFERGELPRGKTVQLLKSALESRGVEFTNGDRPGVRLRPIDVAAMETAPWSPWRIVPNDSAAVVKIRREWPGLPGQNQTARGALLFFAPSTQVVVAQAEPAEMGGSWRYRTKPRILEPLSHGGPHGAEIDFQYNLGEIVQMQGVGLLSLKSALSRMPDRIAATGMLFREMGKEPSFFDAAQIEALLAKHRPELAAGNPDGHREADEHDG